MKLEFETNTTTVPFVDNGLANEVNFENGSTETVQMLRAGIKAAQDGNRGEARQYLLRVTDADPNNENAWLWLASISEYPEELLIFLNNVLNINAGNERALEWAKATKSLLSKTFVQRGIDASKESHADFAKQCFLQAIVHDSHNEMAWLWLASVSDTVEEKSAYLQKVLTINPANETASALLQSAKRQQAETQMQKALAAAAADNRDGATKIVQEVLRQTPEMEDAWILKSYLTDSFSDKIACFKKILELNPDNGLAQVNLISLLGMMAKAEAKKEVENFDPVLEVEAVEAAQTATKLDDFENAGAALFSDEQTNEEFFEEEAQSAGEVEQIKQMSEQPAEENQFVEDSQDAIPTRELDFLPNSEPEENHFEAAVPEMEEDNFEASRVIDNAADDVPELEFETAEMSAAAGLNEIGEDFYDSLEDSPVEMESEMPESADTYENSVDETAVELELAGENSVEPELAEDNPADDEPQSAKELQVSENTELTYPNYSYAEPVFFDETAAAQPVYEDNFAETAEAYSGNAEAAEVSMPEENSEDAAVSLTEEVALEYSNNIRAEYVETEEVFASNVAAENDYAAEAENHYAPRFEEAENYSPAENYAAEESVQEQVEVAELADDVAEFEQTEVEEYGAEEDYNYQTAEHGAENGGKPHVEMLACPFCNSENEANSFVCNSCRAMLTLSDLEMLLAHHNADTERLSQAVERMEVEKNLHDFSSDELKFLGIGQINLKYLRSGFANLQEASKLNPNDIVLSSQVNALAIRLSEIEKQESIHSSMPKNRTILVVDDSATVRKLVSGKLEKCGHEVVCAIDGVDALEKINALVPDLILLDITMPRMDGYQVCKLIRSNEATKDVPIVMISGKDGFFDKVRGRMAGTTGYITKPFGPETLMKTVEAYIIPA